MRVVAGRLRGSKIAAPKDSAIRPTSDRVRESLFNILAHGIEGFDLEDARILDLFAGTGALGIEALSRGARFCLFVDNSAEARALQRQNVEALELTGVTKIWRRDAARLGPLRGQDPFDCVFLDPPYGQGLGDQALIEARDGAWLAPGAIAVVEERESSEIAIPEGFKELDRRTYGDTQILILQLT